jgi:hypothetical protein
MLTKIFSLYTILFVKSMYMLLLHLVRCLSTSNYKLPTKFPRPFLYSYLPIRLQISLYNYKLHRLVWLDSHLLLVKVEILEEKGCDLLILHQHDKME